MSKISDLEAQAKAKAVERIASLIQRPDQLEKVEEYKKRESRKKAAKEAMLKTALQSQLEGVRTGFQLLKSSRVDLEQVGKHTNAIEKGLKEVPKLAKTLEELREETLKHSQYEMAMENMSNIFNIGRNLEKAHALIADGNLLLAHLRLIELEASRDELLFELFRMGNKSEVIMLHEYFSDVEKLSETLERQLALNFKRIINIAVHKPNVLVTSLRIIEREEKADARAAERFDMTGFSSPGRPKRWKRKAFQILEESVREKLEGSQLENRSENKLWLVKYLEVIRLLVRKDLQYVKQVVVSCFPPSYNILSKFIDIYHNCVSRLLSEVVAAGLEGNEYVSLLAWARNTYCGPELLHCPELDLHKDALPKSPLDEKTMEKLTADYLKYTADNYRSWRVKTVAKEVEEWGREGAGPRIDAEGFYHTEAPVDVFQMANENLRVAQTVGPELVRRMLHLSLDMIREYGQAYGDEVRDFKERYFEDRSKVEFTHYMIAILNNAAISLKLVHETKDRYWDWDETSADSKAAASFEAVLQTFENLRNKAAGYLLDEAFLDLEPHFVKLGTQHWLKSTVDVDTICVTLEDYFSDYKHLKGANFEQVMKQGRNLVAKKYLLAIMSRKLSLKNGEERRDAAEKIRAEVKKIRSLFDRVGGGSVRGECPLEAIDAITEVLSVEDLDILSLELHSFVRRYPDLTREQLMALLSLRGDIGRFDLKSKAAEIIPASHRGTTAQSIFSQVPVGSALFN